jgi:hypothetical protein
MAHLPVRDELSKTSRSKEETNQATFSIDLLLKETHDLRKKLQSKN